MKKVLYLIILLVLPLFVFAEGEININGLERVINSGDITKQFIKEKKRLNIEAKISSYSTNSGLNINVKLNGESLNKDFTIELLLDGENNILEANNEFDEDEVDSDYVDIYKLIPLWGIESSSYYNRIKGYRVTGDDYIDYLNKIFDKCYMSEYGVCYTTETHNGITLIKSKLELTNKGPKYAIKQLEKRSNKNRDDKLLTIALVIIIVILPIFLVLRKKQYDDASGLTAKKYKNIYNKK